MIFMNIDDFVLESAYENSDSDILMELFGFGKKKDEPKEYNSNDTFHHEERGRYLTIEEAMKVFDSASEEAKSRFRRTANYIKAAAVKGNARIDAEVDRVINSKKHEMLNKIMKGVVKATIVSLLVAALTAAIVIPGGGIAAAAAAAKFSGGASAI